MNGYDGTFLLMAGVVLYFFIMVGRVLKRTYDKKNHLAFTLFYWSLLGLIGVWFFPITLSASSYEKVFSLLPFSEWYGLFYLKFFEQQSVFSLAKDMAQLWVPTLLAAVIFGWAIPLLAHFKSQKTSALLSSSVVFLLVLLGILYQYVFINERVVDTGILLLSPLAALLGNKLSQIIQTKV